MAAELVIAKVLVPWLEARDGRLAGKVYTFLAVPPGVAGPYCTHAKVRHDRWHHYTGHAGASRARIQLDFWSTDHLEAHQVAAKVAGDLTDPGLDRFRGDLGNVVVMDCVRVDEGEDAEPADDGSEATWFRVRADYLIIWNEQGR